MPAALFLVSSKCNLSAASNAHISTVSQDASARPQLCYARQCSVLETSCNSPIGVVHSSCASRLLGKFVDQQVQGTIATQQMQVLRHVRVASKHARHTIMHIDQPFLWADVQVLLKVVDEKAAHSQGKCAVDQCALVKLVYFGGSFPWSRTVQRVCCMQLAEKGRCTVADTGAVDRTQKNLWQQGQQGCVSAPLAAMQPYT